MRLLLLNDYYFGNEFQNAGIETFKIGPGPNMDLIVDPSTEDLQSILNRIEFKPDVILQVDSIDTRVFFKGIENVQIPTVFYAIDSPINEFWQESYAYAFDRIYVDQYNQWRKWLAKGIDWVRWLPLAADTEIYHPADNQIKKDIPIVFVGTIDSALRPKRSAILYRLKQVAEVKVIDGNGSRSEKPENVAEYYRRARIVLNELLFEGINLRSFEAMASGTVLLTERNNGEDRLFQDGIHLATYNQDDLESVVTELLANNNLCEEISYNAARLVEKSHTITHRVSKIVKDISNLEVRKNRNSISNQIQVAWGAWQASWKWNRNLGWLMHHYAQILNKDFNYLEPIQAAVFLSANKNYDAAIKILEELFHQNHTNQMAIALLASIALENKELESAGIIVGTNGNTSYENVHLAIGDLLMKIGNDLTPGFNRTSSHIACWSAFDHYLYVYNNDLNNREALTRMEIVLSKYHATEFIVPLWQRFHAYNPTDTDAMERLRRTAQKGYYLPASQNVSNPYKKYRNNLKSAKPWERRSKDTQIRSFR